MKLKEIGSTYWLSPNTTNGFMRKSLKTPDVFEGASYVSTCRSAIGIVLDILLPSEHKVALLPAFTCESVLVAFVDRGYVVYPYPIRRDLTIAWNQFLERIEKVQPSVVLVHSYFGFDTIAELRPHVLELRDKGIIVIEDETQSMFNSKPLAHANYYVGSIRKWMPLPDGAFVSVPFHSNKEDIELVEAKMEAFTKKGNWVLNGVGEKPVFQQAFRKAEGILDRRKEPFSMSSISCELYACTDIESMKAVRRDNCQAILNGIMVSKALSDHLQLPISRIEAHDCPFHLPVLVKEGRKELQQYLAQHDIFATVIWGCPTKYKGIVDEESKYVYDHILCFHVDQRYDQNDMMRIIDALKAFYEVI